MDPIKDKSPDILDLLNWEHLPEPVQQYLGRLRGKYSFFDDLYNFKWGLEDLPSGFAEQDYFKNLFLGLVYYFLKDEDERNAVRALKCLNSSIAETKNIIIDPKNQVLIRSTLISVKHRLTRLDKILFLVDDKYDTEVNFRSIRRHYEKNVKAHWVSKFDERKFEEALHMYDQLFIFAHGDESGTALGDKEITANWLTQKLDKPGLNLSVLGLFSCQENLSESDVKNHVDYFITDSIMSNPHMNEMFSYGYIQNYLKSYRVFNSFEIGTLSLIFRATSNVGIQLYEGGRLIST